MPTPGLTLAEEGQVIALLAKIPAGSGISNDLYYAFARLLREAAMEVLIFRKNSETGDIEVLMDMRPPSDPFFAGQWAAPGTMLQASDEILEFSYQRIHSKLGVVNFASRPVFVENWADIDARGPSVHLIHWATIDEMPRRGKFFPVNNLPQPLVSCQHYMVKRALPSFEASEFCR